MVNDISIKKKLLLFFNTWKALLKCKLRMAKKDVEKRNTFHGSLRSLFDIGKNFKAKTREEKQAMQYLQKQREQAHLEEETEVLPTNETISCSDFEEEGSSQRPDQICSATSIETSSQNDSQAGSVYSPSTSERASPKTGTL